MAEIATLLQQIIIFEVAQAMFLFFIFMMLLISTIGGELMEYWKTKQYGDVYEPSNRLTQDDCWQAYEAMEAGERSTMNYYANKLVKRVPKLGIKGAVEVIFKLQLFYRLHEVKS